MGLEYIETRIPGGFGQVDRLGECDKDDVNKIALVSYLKSPLKYAETTNELSENIYVVLFDFIPDNMSSITFDWEISLYKEGLGEAIYTIPIGDPEKGVLKLDSITTKQLWCLYMANKIIIRVTPTGFPTLKLEQPIENSVGNIRDMLTNNIAGNAAGGASQITRKIAADYKELFNEIENIDPQVKEVNCSRKRDLIVAIIYQTELEKLDKIFEWTTVITLVDYKWTNVVKKKVGITGLNPPLAMSFLKNDYTSGDPHLLSVPGSGSGSNPYLSRLYTRFENEVTNLDKLNTVTDIFNLLRFPRSSIELCGLYLEKIRGILGYGAYSWDEIILKHTDTELLKILQYYFNGPDITKKSIANDVLSIINSDFIRLLSAKNVCEAFRQITSAGIPINFLSFGGSSIGYESVELVEVVVNIDTELLRPYTTIISDTPDTYNTLFHFGLRTMYNLQVEMTCDTGETVTFAFYFVLDYVVVLNPNLDVTSEVGQAWLDKLEATPREKLYQVLRNNRAPLHYAENFDCSLELFQSDDSGTVTNSIETITNIDSIMREMNSILGFVYKAFRECFCDLIGPDREEMELDYRGLQKFRIKLEEVKSFLMPIYSESRSCPITVVPHSPVNIVLRTFSFQPDTGGNIPHAPYNWANLFFSRQQLIQFFLDEPGDENDRLASNAKPLKDANEISKMNDAFKGIFDDLQKTVASLKLVIRGYADKSYSGSVSRENHNQRLSERRAKWTKKHYLAWQHTQSLADKKTLTDADIETQGCGHNQATSLIGIDNERDLQQQEYRDARMVLMVKK